MTCSDVGDVQINIEKEALMGGRKQRQEHISCPYLLLS